MTYDDRIPSPYGAEGASEAIAGFWTPRRLAFPVFLIFSIWVVFAGWSAGLVDPDYYWHLEAGELIWQTGALPDGDPFSWTFEGQPWVLHEWLFQVGLHLLHAAVGPVGVALATALMLAVAWYLAFSVADGFIHRPLVSFGLAVAFGAGIVAAAAPRPHMVSILFFAILLAVFFRAKYRRRHLGLLLVPVLMIPWVNMHGGFVLGVAVMLALAGMEWLNLFGRPELRNRGQLWFCLWLSVAAALTVAASVVNPDGIEHWTYPLYVAQLDLVGAISEWQSIATSPARGLWYAGGAVLFFMVTLGSDRRLDVTELLFPVAVFIAGLLQARHAPFATLTFLCFAGPCVARETTPHPAPGGALAQATSWVLALAAMVVPAWAFTQSAYMEAARRLMPSDVVAFVKEADLKGRMFNDYDVGGYLIAELYPERKVFIDGRADLYGDEMYSAYAATMFGTAPLSAHFDGWQIDYVIARPEAPLVHLLEQRGDFSLVYQGRSHGVWIGRDGADAATLERHPPLR